MRLSLISALTLVLMPSLWSAPGVGEQAPDFSLRGSDGRVYHLSDFRGKQPVVLAWFPKAFTGG